MKANAEDNQFYPTPSSLAAKMWDKFQESPFHNDSYVLEPSAGRGDLLAAREARCRYMNNESIDVIEIDFDNQAIVRELGYNVVGHDFLQFQGGKFYTHIIMNPPFIVGAKHVLHAIDILRSGELVALLNAQTLKKPNNKHRQTLAKVLDTHHADIEYLQGEFQSPDTKRQTSVEVALIHLKKDYDFSDLDFLETLKPDLRSVSTASFEAPQKQELALKQDTVKQVVTVFNTAAQTLENEIRIKTKLCAETAYYMGLLSESILKPQEEQKKPNVQSRVDAPAEEFNQRYLDLKERAWSHILTATDVGKHLSSKVQNSLTKQFKEVIQLEFTAQNIYGFLQGLVENRSEMTTHMLIDIFDTITEYCTGNRAWYKGWKSNDKHKTNAYRIKMSRFILPFRESCDFYLPHSMRQKLHDFDLAFAHLDGKKVEHITGICDLFENKDSLNKLKGGERLSATYFDIRYYFGAGTVHFFPRKQKLIERLNRLVGRERQWLPPAEERVSDAFWVQYEAAEAITREMDRQGNVHLDYAYGLNRGDKAEQINTLIHHAGERLHLQMDNLLEFKPAKTETPSSTVKPVEQHKKPKSPRPKPTVDRAALEQSVDNLISRYQLKTG